ncbi:hypothetical protein WJX72_006496 [[Myrmecia] bisecta]|uniref:beta-galactoside alpha-(2,6)-sialyltransferase n=1 Tax=[Myrmecia] bisecta TaxID=41462 RepID=A0AAW1QFF8_9CHLO
MKSVYTAGLILLALVVFLQLQTLQLQQSVEESALLSQRQLDIESGDILLAAVSQGKHDRRTSQSAEATRSTRKAAGAVHIKSHTFSRLTGVPARLATKVPDSKQQKQLRRQRQLDDQKRREEARKARLQELYGNYTVHPGNFTGHVAMSRASVPQVGEQLVSPWRVYTSGHPRTLGRVTERMLSVLPANDPFATIRFPTCAVVGSAGLLLTQRFGREIDEHAAVIRFNLAPTKGFETHVGSKTSIRLVNRKHFGFRETMAETVLQHITLPEVMKDFVKLLEQNASLPTYGLDMSFYEQVIDWQRVQQPTNGFVGLKLALILCKKVDVYGFMRSYRGWFKYHYFDDEEPNETQYARDNQGELPIIQEIMAQQFVHG